LRRRRGEPILACTQIVDPQTGKSYVEKRRVRYDEPLPMNCFPLRDWRVGAPSCVNRFSRQAPLPPSSEALAMHPVRVGTCGWSYKEWVVPSAE
jgi:hypothetical protein